MNYQKQDNITPTQMSLLNECGCMGKCCIGRIMVTVAERRIIINRSGRDEFIHWRGDIYFLERGPCPHLYNGLCSVQDIKPFVCMIFPYVPRVVDGKLWLYLASECNYAPHIPECYTKKAIELAQSFFKHRELSEYVQYWNENKVGDFNEEKIIAKVQVSFDDKV